MPLTANNPNKPTPSLTVSSIVVLQAEGYTTEELINILNSNRVDILVFGAEVPSFDKTEHLPASHPLDVCECGDYRRDHVDDSGQCKFSVDARGDGHSGAGRCDQFRLSHKYRVGDYVPAGFSDSEQA